MNSVCKINFLLFILSRPVALRWAQYRGLSNLRRLDYVIVQS